VDETREPGIRLAGVVVEQIRFDDMKAGEMRPKNLQFGLLIERRPGETPSVAEAVLRFTLRPGEGDVSTFYLEIALAGRFEQDADNANMPLDAFLRINGPALLVPFARELIANVTARSRHGLVLLPAINVVALVQRTESAAQKPAPSATP